MRRDARCQCGQLSITCAGEPQRVSACHCLDCKVRTGSPFSWNAWFPADAVTVRGEPRRYTRLSEDNTAKHHHLCPTCGTTVFYELEVRPGMVGVPAGGFADPGFPAPGAEIYQDRAVAWCTLVL